MRVGTSVSRLCLASADKDHPHACGDKSSFRKRKFLYSGSSPCVWGQVNTFVTISLPLRIIPMRVGTSRKPDCIYNPYEDHPHACGDKYCINLDTASPQGSSPCVWGQAQYCFAVAHGHRIIPMRVGTRTLTCTDLQLMRDHPHACGDKSKSQQAQHLSLGSSPCVWGQVNSPLSL